MTLKEGRPPGIYTPIKYPTEVEKMQARAESLKKKYVSSHPWYCTVCEREYTATSKTPHLKTKKHKALSQAQQAYAQPLWGRTIDSECPER